MLSHVRPQVAKLDWEETPSQACADDSGEPALGQAADVSIEIPEARNGAFEPRDPTFVDVAEPHCEFEAMPSETSAEEPCDSLVAVEPEGVDACGAEVEAAAVALTEPGILAVAAESAGVVDSGPQSHPEAIFAAVGAPTLQDESTGAVAEEVANAACAFQPVPPAEPPRQEESDAGDDSDIENDAGPGQENQNMTVLTKTQKKNRRRREKLKAIKRASKVGGVCWLEARPERESGAALITLGC
jgi:hypothetical protein